VKRLHWLSQDRNLSLCGQVDPLIATSTADVTCKGCREKLGKEIAKALRQPAGLRH
jgi:hypothetical protein